MKQNGRSYFKMEPVPTIKKLKLPVCRVDAIPATACKHRRQCTSRYIIDHTHHLLIHESLQELRQKEHQVAIYAMKGTTHDFQIVNYT